MKQKLIFSPDLEKSKYLHIFANTFSGITLINRNKFCELLGRKFQQKQLPYGLEKGSILMPISTGWDVSF